MNIQILSLITGLAVELGWQSDALSEECQHRSIGIVLINPDRRHVKDSFEHRPTFTLMRKAQRAVNIIKIESVWLWIIPAPLYPELDNVANEFSPIFEIIFPRFGVRRRSVVIVRSGQKTRVSYQFSHGIHLFII